MSHEADFKNREITQVEYEEKQLAEAAAAADLDKLKAGTAAINAAITTLASLLGLNDEEAKEILARSAVRILLECFGQDVDSDDMIDTPKRYVKFLKEFLSPKEIDFEYSFFGNQSIHDHIVIQKNVQFFSLCEHHMAPFFGKVAVAYIPGNKIIGLSKLTRTIDHYARKFQNQERITAQVADKLMEVLGAKGVAVHIESQHLCVGMRGIKKPGALMVTTQYRGAFENNALRINEFLQLIKE